jgi:hypothetical protein
MNKPIEFNRRIVVRALLVSPLALTTPARSAQTPMNVNQAIKRLFNGVFTAAAQQRLLGAPRQR